MRPDICQAIRADLQRCGSTHHHNLCESDQRRFFLSLSKTLSALLSPDAREQESLQRFCEVRAQQVQRVASAAASRGAWRAWLPDLEGPLSLGLGFGPSVTASTQAVDSLFRHVAQSALMRQVRSALMWQVAWSSWIR